MAAFGQLPPALSAIAGSCPVCGAPVLLDAPPGPALFTCDCRPALVEQLEAETEVLLAQADLVRAQAERLRGPGLAKLAATAPIELREEKPPVEGCGCAACEGLRQARARVQAMLEERGGAEAPAAAQNLPPIAEDRRGLKGFSQWVPEDVAANPPLIAGAGGSAEAPPDEELIADPRARATEAERDFERLWRPSWPASPRLG